MIAEKYSIWPSWKQTCDGQECECAASCAAECSCYDVDWTTRTSYELMIEVNTLRAENNALRMEPK